MPIILDGTAGIDNDATDLSYTGTLTGGTGVVNLGSGQVYKDASGNVGIGTSSPAGKFNVSGSVANDLTTFSTADAATTVLNNANGVATGRASKILFRNSGFNLSGIAGVYTGFNGAGDLAGALAFGTQTNAAGGVAERARIDSSGNLLVGTTSGSRRLNVSFVAASGGAIFETTDADATYLAFLRSGITVVNQQIIGSSFRIVNQFNGVSLANSGTSWGAVSDERKKDIIEPIENAIEKVSSLRAVIGRYKTDEPEKRRAFLVAQDVQAVLPEAVYQNSEDDDTLNLAYTDTIPLLVKAIQELKAINDAQAQTIESLTARVVALEQV